MELGVFFAVFVIAMLLGMPIAFAMIIGTVAYALLAQIELGFLTLQMFAGLDSFLLLAIPLFILTSEVMDRSGVATRIYDFAHVLVGRLPGGMAHVDVVTSVIFSGMSGSALADVGGIGRTGYLAMVNKGYPAPFSAAVVVTSSVIGPLIPPSIPMVVLAMVSGISIQRLFFGGALPGLLVAVAMLLHAADAKVEELTPKSFKTTVLDSQDAWMVLFYAPWCGHCSMMAPAYNSLARTVHGEWKGAQVGEVNCDAHPGNKF